MFRNYWPPAGIIFGLLLAAVILSADLWTKRLASQYLDYGKPVFLMPFFNLTLQFNAGAAFSFLSDAGGWQRWFFSGIAIVISIILLVWMMRLKKEQKLLLISLSLILSGALGNLWDRLTLGYVIDFISLHYDHYYFPTFNVADSAISVGAVLMLLDTFLHPGEKS